MEIMIYSSKRTIAMTLTMFKNKLRFVTGILTEDQQLKKKPDQHEAEPHTSTHKSEQQPTMNQPWKVPLSRVDMDSDIDFLTRVSC